MAAAPSLIVRQKRRQKTVVISWCLSDFGDTTNADRIPQGKSRTGSKNPTHSCPGDRWKWSAFYAIAEFLEFPHHACGARAFGLGTHRWPPFLVADPLMEDHPQHSAESMGDGPDGLLVPQTRQQPAEGQ